MNIMAYRILENEISKDVWDNIIADYLGPSRHDVEEKRLLVMEELREIHRDRTRRAEIPHLSQRILDRIKYTWRYQGARETYVIICELHAHKNTIWNLNRLKEKGNRPVVSFYKDSLTISKECRHLHPRDILPYLQHIRENCELVLECSIPIFKNKKK